MGRRLEVVIRSREPAAHPPNVVPELLSCGWEVDSLHRTVIVRAKAVRCQRAATMSDSLSLITLLLGTYSSSEKKTGVFSLRKFVGCPCDSLATVLELTRGERRTISNPFGACLRWNGDLRQRPICRKHSILRFV